MKSNMLLTMLIAAATAPACCCGAEITYADNPTNIAYFENTDITDVVLADLDNDGNVDLLTAHDEFPDNSGIIKVAYNKGGGIFDLPQPLFGPAQEKAIGGNSFRVGAVADVNGDGLLDVVGCFASGGLFAGFDEPGVVVLGLNDGNRGFSLSSIVSNNSYRPDYYFPSCRNVKVADFDGDGDQDIVVSLAFGPVDSPRSSHLLYFENDGSESFSSKIINDSDFIGKTNIDVNDFDGDGKPDIVAVDHNRNWLTIFYNEMTSTGGGFSMVTVDHQSSSWALASGPVLATTTGGLPDIVGIGKAGPDTDDRTLLTVYQNQGGRTFTKRSIDMGGNPYASFEACNECYHILIHDYDGDGMKDIVTAESYDHVRVYHNSDGTLEELERGQKVTPQGDIVTATALAVGDLTGDGLLDLVVADGKVKHKRVLMYAAKEGEDNPPAPAPQPDFSGVRPPKEPSCQSCSSLLPRTSCRLGGVQVTCEDKCHAAGCQQAGCSCDIDVDHICISGLCNHKVSCEATPVECHDITNEKLCSSAAGCFWSSGAPPGGSNAFGSPAVGAPKNQDMTSAPDHDDDPGRSLQSGASPASATMPHHLR